jgi:3-isopropylmalate/(R)-2-methylmalate dehydratase small subunit
MDEVIRGLAYVVGDDVDTDQIIPAKYLMYNPADASERKMFGRYALSGVPDGARGLPDGHVPFVDTSDENNTRSAYSIVVAGTNFGCGSSREHAPLALAEAGVRAVVAQSYARIFFRNSVNGGYLIPYETQSRLVNAVQTGDQLEIHTADHRLVNVTRSTDYRLGSLSDVAPIVEAGGIFAYARKAGML